MDGLWGTAEPPLRMAFFSLTHWMTWPVVLVAGVLVKQWWAILIAGASVAILTEVFVVSALREAFAPTGLIGARDLGAADFVPGVVVGAILTFVVQRLVILARKASRGSVEDWNRK
jgi:hypothetical protein